MKAKKRSDTGIWVKDYSPGNLKDYVCSESYRKKFQSFIDNEEIPNLMFSGPPGNGKSSLSHILIKSIPCDYMKINASDERGIDIIRNKIKPYAQSMGFDNKWKIVYLEESDKLTSDAFASLKDLIEEVYSHCRFIFTTNYPNTIPAPIKSRLQSFEFKSFTKDQIVQRLKDILDNEEVEYNEDDLNEIARNTYPDIRSAINFCQRNTQDNKLELEDSSFSENINKQILQLLAKKDWFAIRKLVNEEGIIYEQTYKYLFDFFIESEKLSDDKIAKICLLIDERIYRHSLVADPDINFASMILEIVEEL